MASQVTVLSPSARQITIKTKPEMHLADVLTEACNKLRLDPGQYGMKHNNRELDLSNAMRHSGLSPGARLQLTLLSKSPLPINVALQLPSGTRLTEKFPNNTTLWAVLRTFEDSTSKGSGAREEITSRSVAKETTSGSGRLYYEIPVLQNQGRSWGSFTDLQKTLAQVGFVRGSVLFRLGFQATETPFEEAQVQISQYFQSAGPKEVANGQELLEPASTQSSEIPTATLAQDTASPSVEPKDTESGSAATVETEETAKDKIEDDNDLPDSGLAIPPEVIGSRRTVVYSAPSSSTPQAAQEAYNPDNYQPSVEHAKAHQALLAKAGQNKRLESDADLEAQQQANAEKLASIQEVELRVRLPDQHLAQATFKSNDTADDLYKYVQESLLRYPDEPFTLKYWGNKNMVVVSRGSKRLIQDLGFVKGTIITMIWGDGAHSDARDHPSLKGSVLDKAAKIPIPTAPKVEDETQPSESGNSEKEKKTSSKKGMLQNMISKHMKKR